MDGHSQSSIFLGARKYFAIANTPALGRARCDCEIELSDEQRPAWQMSTPMIKGELLSLLKVLAPEKKWTKSSRLKDYVEFAVGRFPPDTSDERERRALLLAYVLHDKERR